MKINRLTIHNIASIIDTTIDFTTYPLAGESIFLISGDTGSGKTTVLNAICMALYDKVPALYNASGDKDSAGMSINSAMQLARRDASDFASVTLLYEGKDRRMYEATWQLNKITRGANKGEFKSRPDRSLALLDANGKEEMVITGVREIDARVQKTVDLTFEQFCRTTMLAQGQFLKFLESSEREKCEILEKLTGTEIYKRIGEEVNAMYKASEEEYNTLNQKLEEVNSQLMDDQAIAEAEAEKERLAGRASELQAEQEQARGQIAWLETRQKIEEQLEKSMARLEAAKARDVEDERKKLAAWDATSRIREILGQKKALADELNKIERQSETLADEAAAVRAGQKALSEKLSQSEAEADTADEELAGHQGSESLYENLSQIKLLADSINGDIKAIDDSDKAAESLEKSLEQTQKDLEAKQALQATAKDNFDKARAAHKELEQKKKAFDITEINKRKTELVKRKDALTELKNAAESHAEKSSDLEKAQTELAQKKQDLADATAAAPLLQKASDEAQAAHKTLSDKLQGQMDLKDKLAELKIIFHDEKKCPLCGSTDGNICAESVIDSAIEQERKRVEQAEANWKKALTELNEKKAEEKTLKADVEKGEKELERVSKLAGNAAKLLEAAKAKAEAPEVADLQAWAESRILEISAGIDKCDKEHGEASKAISLCDESQKELDKLRGKYEKANEDVQSALLKAEKDKAAIKKHQEMSAAKRDEAKAHVAKLSGLVPAADPMSAALQAEGLPSGLDSHIARIEKAKKRHDELMAQKESLAATAKDLAEKIAGIDKAFAEMPSLKPSDSAAIEPDADVMEMCRKAEASYQRLEALRVDNEAKTANATTQEKEYFQSHDRAETMAQLDTLAGNPQEEDAAQWRRTLQEHDSELRTAQAFVDSAKKDQSAHMARKPEQLAVDAVANDINETLNKLAEEHKAAIEQRVKIEQQLKNNDELKAKVAEDLPRLRVLEGEYHEWKEIDGMFGSTKSRNQFGVIAQRYIFNQLLERANEYLRQLNPRYSLKCRLDSMQIYVVDHYLGDAERVANGLSGGEGFIASLSLALALSSINNDRESVDTIFIDEGFGTLSSDLLQTVIDMLDRLQNGLGRRVGIISHIDFLKERIQTKICLEPIPGKSASEVKVVPQQQSPQA